MDFNSSVCTTEREAKHPLLLRKGAFLFTVLEFAVWSRAGQCIDRNSLIPWVTDDFEEYQA